MSRNGLVVLLSICLLELLLTPRSWGQAIPPNKPLPPFAYPGFAKDCALSPDGKKLVITGSLAGSFQSDGGFMLWDLAAKKIILSDGHSWYNVAFSPDGKHIVSDWVSEINVMDVATQKYVWKLRKCHWGSMNKLAFSPDGKYVVSTNIDATLKLWNFAQKKLETTYYYPTNARGSTWHTSSGVTEKDPPATESPKSYLIIDDLINFSVYDFSFTPDSKTIAVATGTQNVKLLETTSARILGNIRTDIKAISVAYSKDGKLLAVGGPLKNGKIEVWDMEKRKRIITLAGHIDTVLNLAISPDNKTLVSGGVIDGARIWDIETGKQKLHGHPELLRDENASCIAGLGFFPDGRTIYTLYGGIASPVQFWDTATCKRVDDPFRK